MRKSAPIEVVVHYPKTEEGWEELGKRVATAHANYVIEKIERLNCPTWQKLELYQAVIDTTKGTYKPKEHQKPGWHKWRSAPGGWSRRCPRLSSGQWCPKNYCIRRLCCIKTMIRLISEKIA